MSLSDEISICVSRDELEPLAMTLLSIAGVDIAPVRVRALGALESDKRVPQP